MATEKPLFDTTEKAFLQAAIALKTAQVKRQISAEIDPAIIRMRNEHVGILSALSDKIRSL